MSTIRNRLADRYINELYPDATITDCKRIQAWFAQGTEWALSDYEGRRLLHELAPTVYPENLDELLI